MNHFTNEVAVSDVRSAGRPKLDFNWVLGPLAPGKRVQYLFLPFLLADGLAVWWAMQGYWAMPVLLVVLVRIVAAASLFFLPTRRLTEEDGQTHLLNGIAYFFTLACIAATSRGGVMGNVLGEFPAASTLRIAVSSSVDNAIAYLTVQGDGFFRVVTKALLTLLTGLEGLLANVPWPVFFAICGVLAWRRGGPLLVAVAWGALGYIGVFGFWDEAVQTAALVLASLVVCIALGIPMGVALAKSRICRVVLSPVLDLMQTMPSFVYLLPAVAFFSIGKPPALIATVIFSLPPLIRLTALGIQQVPLYVHEAMQAHGATPIQTLLKAELPLALPSIRTGINQTIMMCLSMVVIAALIGGGGLGYSVLFALQNVQYGEGALAGLAIVFCAVLFDRLLRSTRSET